MLRQQFPSGSISALRRVYAHHAFGQGALDSSIGCEWRPSEDELAVFLGTHRFKNVVSQGLSSRLSKANTAELLNSDTHSTAWLRSVTGLSACRIANYKRRDDLECAGHGMVSRRSAIEFFSRWDVSEPSGRWLRLSPEWNWRSVLRESGLLSSGLQYDHGDDPAETLASLAGYEFNPPVLLVSWFGIAELYQGSAGRELVHTVLSSRLSAEIADVLVSDQGLSDRCIEQTLSLGEGTVKTLVHRDYLRRIRPGDKVIAGSVTQYVLTRRHTPTGWQLDVDSPFVRKNLLMMH